MVRKGMVRINSKAAVMKDEYVNILCTTKSIQASSDGKPFVAHHPRATKTSRATNVGVYTYRSATKYGLVSPHTHTHTETDKTNALVCYREYGTAQELPVLISPTET